MEETRIHRTSLYSGPGCHWGCGSPGASLSTGAALTRVMGHPDRLLYLLKLVGERGEGKWQRNSWDEAYDTIETKFRYMCTSRATHSSAREKTPYPNIWVEVTDIPVGTTASMNLNFARVLSTW